MRSLILTLPTPPSDGNLGPLPPSQLAADHPPALATHTRTIGIIHPPLQIRLIIDKTATLVAKYGPKFEKLVLSKAKLDIAKFNFLFPSDPYNAYYQHRVAELQSSGSRAQPQRPGMPQMIPSVRPLPPPMISSAQQPIMMNQPAISVNPPSIPVPPPPGSQFTPIIPPRPFLAMPMPLSHMPVMLPPLPQGIMPPPPEDETPPPLPDEPEPKRLRVDDASFISEDQFLAQHPGSVYISVSIPNVDEGNLKGQLLLCLKL